MNVQQVMNAYAQACAAGDTTEADRLGQQLDQHDHEQRQRLNAPDALLNSALWYATNNILVFPLQPRGKHPLTTHGFKDATTDPEQVRRWWAATPDANIGVPTGHQFDVIDIDGADGVLTMFAGPRLADGLTILGHATTARAGGHHLYVPPTGRGNKTSIYPGIDYRGANGYVVAPPSVGANSRRYAWLTPLTIPTGQHAA